MFEVEAVPRADIDQWPVEAAGLPTRVINSVHAAGIQTIGQLRAWSDAELLKLRSLGKVSLQQIHDFFALCERIEQSVQRFESVAEVIAIFLDQSQINVIGARYGLYQSDLRASRSWVTLQEIGNREDKTRERIRQIEDLGKQRLSSRLARVCLEPFYQFFAAFIHRRAGVVPAAGLAELQDSPGLGGVNPTGILLLLSDLAPDRITFHHGLFSVLPDDVLRRLETAARRVLERRPAPVPAEVLCAEMEPIEGGPDPASLRQAVPLILDHAPGIGAARDDRYFLYTTSVHPFLTEIMQPVSSPVHYRQVAARFNEHVKPRSRRGAGYILEALNKNPDFRRIDRGMYALRSRTQTEPAASSSQG